MFKRSLSICTVVLIYVCFGFSPVGSETSRYGGNYLSLSETYQHLFGASLGQRLYSLSQNYPQGTKFVVRVMITGFGDKPNIDRMVQSNTPKPFFGVMLYYDKMYIQDMGNAQKWPGIKQDYRAMRLSGMLESPPAFSEHVVDVVYIRLNGAGGQGQIKVLKIKITGVPLGVVGKGSNTKFGLTGELNTGYKGQLDPRIAKWSVTSTARVYDSSGRVRYIPHGTVNNGVFRANYGGYATIQASAHGASDSVTLLVRDDFIVEPQPERRTSNEQKLIKIPLSPSNWTQLRNQHGRIYNASGGLTLQGGRYTNGRVVGGHLDGNGVQSNQTFNFSRGGHIFMKFYVQSQGKYLSVTPKIFSGAGCRRLSTHNVWNRSTLIPENTWLYAHFEALPGGTFKTKICRGNYDFNSGQKIYEHGGRLSSTTGRLWIQFVDNKRGEQTGVTIGEAFVYLSK